MRSPNYVVDKAFPFPHNYLWLDKQTYKLNPDPEVNSLPSSTLRSGVEL